MALVAKVEILGEFKDLARATSGATDNLKKMNKKVGGFSRSMKGSLAGIAAGISFGAITSGLTDATKAAMDDRKAQAILADTLRNTISANDAQIASVENQITTWQNATGILDDDLRPAYGKLVASTEDVTTANDLMDVALDVSAGTGKDLLTVSTLLAKAHGGNLKALDKLVPGISKAKDPMQELADTYAGMSDTAAENDPVSRINVRMADLQEQIGEKLLPYLDQFADWMNTPEGTEFLDTVLETTKLLLEVIVGIVQGLKDIADLSGSTASQVNAAVHSDPAARNALNFSGSQLTNNTTGQSNINRSGGMSTVGAGVPQMADGGVVLPRVGGTLVNVGEAGSAEAIVPLDKAGIGGSNVYNININKASVTGQEVVRAIMDYEKTNGRKFVN